MWYRGGWRRRGGILGGILLVGVVIWEIADAVGTVSVLMQAASPTWRWVLAHGDMVLLLVALVLVYQWLRPHRPAEGFRRAVSAWRERWTVRNWTDAGLSWRILSESYKALPDGRMLAILAISPLPGSDLPQPLDIVVACAGRIAEVGSTFHADPSNPDKVHSSGDVVIQVPRTGGQTVLRLTLCSPKLFPPARWDLTLVSAGNATPKVEYVKRAPRGRG